MRNLRYPHNINIYPPGGGGAGRKKDKMYKTFITPEEDYIYEVNNLDEAFEVYKGWIEEEGGNVDELNIFDLKEIS